MLIILIFTMNKIGTCGVIMNLKEETCIDWSAPVE